MKSYKKKKKNWVGRYHLYCACLPMTTMLTTAKPLNQFSETEIMSNWSVSHNFNYLQRETSQYRPDWRRQTTALVESTANNDTQVSFANIPLFFYLNLNHFLFHTTTRKARLTTLFELLLPKKALTKQSWVPCYTYCSEFICKNCDFYWSKSLSAVWPKKPYISIRFSNADRDSRRSTTSWHPLACIQYGIYHLPDCVLSNTERHFYDGGV